MSDGDGEQPPKVKPKAAIAPGVVSDEADVSADTVKETESAAEAEAVGE